MEEIQRQVSTARQWTRRGSWTGGTQSGAIKKEPEGRHTMESPHERVKGRVFCPTRRHRARRAQAELRPPEAARTGGGSGEGGGEEGARRDRAGTARTLGRGILSVPAVVAAAAAAIAAGQSLAP